MIRSGTFLSFILAALVFTLTVGSSVTADEYIYGGTVQRIADHCARLGDGFVDLGGGVCGRVSRHIRVGTGNAAMNGWTSGGTTNAAMQSTGSGMVPGAEVTQRLRVRSNLDSASPFR